MPPQRPDHPVPIIRPGPFAGIVPVMASSPTRQNTPARAWAAKPLSGEEWAHAQRVAERLHADLGHLVALLPEHARNPSGMSRHLGVLRVSCQRVVSALQEPAGSPTMLAKLPGVDGLRQVLDAMTAAGLDAEALSAATSAVDALARLITTLGGSHTRLIERLSLSTTAAAPQAALADTAARKRLFEAAAGVTGRSCECSLSVYAFRLAPDDPATLERALAKGLLQSLVTPGGLPMVLSSGDTVKSDDEVRELLARADAQPRARTPEAILKPFSSTPLPMVTSRTRKGKLYQVIDSTADGPLDVVTALKARHPLMDPDTGRTTLDAVWSLVNCPTARLILDVYLHQDIERRFRPSIDALQWAPDLNIDEDDKWIMRLPSGPRLQLLGRGLSSANSPLNPRHAELSRYFFDYVNFDPDEFVGFRCEVEYPVWRAGYCMAFEDLGT